MSQLLRGKSGSKSEDGATDATTVRVTHKLLPRQQPRGVTLARNDVLDVWIMAGEGTCFRAVTCPVGCGLFTNALPYHLFQQHCICIFPCHHTMSHANSDRSLMDLFF
jgi:hypothetical protein